LTDPNETMLDGSNILVTGATGSFGKRFITTALARFRPRKIIIYSRDELKQFDMSNDPAFAPHNDTLRYFLGDVRDGPRLERAMEGIDVVIHAAALKQVPAAEYNPFEVIKTNILGAQNVIDAAMRSGVSRVISLSTDKAAAPINLYGATKLASDKLFVAANNHKGSRNIRFSVVRYGNVMGSRGSVVPLFLRCRETGVLPVTDARMTRFSITLQEGVDLVLDCLQRQWGGEVFVPKIPSYRIMDVAAAVGPTCRIEFVGMRPGEKLHEEMITDTDALNTLEFNRYYVILPSTPLWDVDQFCKESNGEPGRRVPDGFRYSSGTNPDVLTVDMIARLIRTELRA
jgi:UDP-N-acetylglucosamine 4,6-dehydratase/5-epimerase